MRVIAGATTATDGIRVGAGQSIGSDGAAVIYYGDGSNLSGLPQSGIGIQTSQGSVGYGVTLLKFVGAGVSDFTTPSSGISTITIVGGGGGGGGGSISTEAATVTNGQTATLDLDSAQDHKVTCTGNCNDYHCSGGNEGESHTVRIINSGSATVGFSTYFLFPSGSPPIMPTGTGDISLISFTVNQVGTAGTQLLAGASLNFKRGG